MKAPYGILFFIVLSLFSLQGSSGYAALLEEGDECPLAYIDKGLFLDNELNEVFPNPPEAFSLHIDSVHSDIAFASFASLFAAGTYYLCGINFTNDTAESVLSCYIGFSGFWLGAFLVHRLIRQVNEVRYASAHLAPSERKM